MEHLEGVIDKPENEMTPQELQLHYFKMHDYDGNNLLDGLELATAITHVHKEVGVPGWACICFCLLSFIPLNTMFEFQGKDFLHIEESQSYER